MSLVLYVFDSDLEEEPATVVATTAAVLSTALLTTGLDGVIAVSLVVPLVCNLDTVISLDRRSVVAGVVIHCSSHALVIVSVFMVGSLRTISTVAVSMATMENAAKEEEEVTTFSNLTIFNSKHRIYYQIDLDLDLIIV